MSNRHYLILLIYDTLVLMISLYLRLWLMARMISDITSFNSVSEPNSAPWLTWNHRPGYQGSRCQTSNPRILRNLETCLPAFTLHIKGCYYKAIMPTTHRKITNNNKKLEIQTKLVLGRAVNEHLHRMFCSSPGPGPGTASALARWRRRDREAKAAQGRKLWRWTWYHFWWLKF